MINRTTLYLTPQWFYGVRFRTIGWQWKESNGFSQVIYQHCGMIACLIPDDDVDTVESIKNSAL